MSWVTSLITIPPIAYKFRLTACAFPVPTATPSTPRSPFRLTQCTKGIVHAYPAPTGNPCASSRAGGRPHALLHVKRFTLPLPVGRRLCLDGCVRTGRTKWLPGLLGSASISAQRRWPPRTVHVFDRRKLVAHLADRLEQRMVELGVVWRRICRVACRDRPQWRRAADHPCRGRRPRTDRANELVEWLVGLDIARPPARPVRSTRPRLLRARTAA